MGVRFCCLFLFMCDWWSEERQKTGWRRVRKNLFFRVDFTVWSGVEIGGGVGCHGNDLLRNRIVIYSVEH